jgi:hypothetical protein
MSLFHLLNDLRKAFLGEQASDSIFMALPFLYGDRTTFWGHLLNSGWKLQPGIWYRIRQLKNGMRKRNHEPDVGSVKCSDQVSGLAVRLIRNLRRGDAWATCKNE